MSQLHQVSVLIWLPVVGNLLLALWAGVASIRGRSTLSPAFWATVLLVVALLAVQAVPGLLLLVAGSRPRTGLHLLYAVLVAVAAVAQLMLRPGGMLSAMVRRGGGMVREPRVMALLCLTQAALIMRAWMTATFGR